MHNTKFIIQNYYTDAKLSVVVISKIKGQRLLLVRSQYIEHDKS